MLIPQTYHKIQASVAWLITQMNSLFTKPGCAILISQRLPYRASEPRVLTGHVSSSVQLVEVSPRDADVASLLSNSSTASDN
jgi:hypothetical protein